MKRLIAVAATVTLVATVLSGCDSSPNYHNVRLTEVDCQMVQAATQASTTDNVVNGVLGAVGGYVLGGLIGGKSASVLEAAAGGALAMASGGSPEKYACRLTFRHEGRTIVKALVSEQYYMKDQIITIYNREMQELIGEN